MRPKDRRSPAASSGARVQTVFIVLGVLLAGAAAYASSLIFERQEALAKISRYNLGWTAGQAVQEVSRVQASLGAFALTRGEDELDAVRMWVDIVESRITILRRGETGAFIRADPELDRIVNQMAAAIDAARPLLESLNEPGHLMQLMRNLQQLNAPVARLASVAHARGADLAAQDTRQLDRLQSIFSNLLLGLIVCCLALTVIASWRNRLLAKSNAEVQALVQDLTVTGKSLSDANHRVQEAMAALTEQNQILKRRDAELLRQNQLFDAALNNMSQGLGMFDAEHRLIVSNRRFSDLFRLPADAAKPGAHAAELLALAGSASDGFGKVVTEAAWAEHQELAARSRASTFVREDEEGRSLSISHQPLADGGWVATYEDVTESRRAEARIRHLANHDAVTGLPNRRQFSERLGEALRDHGSHIAVLFLDLDQFKNVNDTLGHQAGDELLRSVAARIREILREDDLVARQGGDEFAVLMKGKAAQPEHAEALAVRIIEAFATPFAIGNYQASVGVSIGISSVTAPMASAETLLKHADMALYKAKAAGRATYRTFEASMAAELQARMDLETDLRGALERSELEVHYQPLLDLRRGHLSGFEALLRWRHPVRGMVSPAEFIPIAEDTGLIVPIGEWTLRQVCMDAATFPKGTKVAVNISPVQFAGTDLLELVRDALARSGMEAISLELEITESALMQDSEAVVELLHRLRALGVRIALDDFGTKYSSLTYLRSFPFDKIKIDQSFVRDMATREDCLAIVRSVARLASQLGMTATAEGVETSAQLDQVREAGCTEAQGYFFGRAEPVESIRRWFETTRPILVANG
ncbi:putative bifunctional diguanylate cyclase/phosphodiesterase [Roseomonas xinghualingensis]|uniref:putative bifunctional diguanylate cyclase/phosphodiesterase n=1 Tax=Roseomonas xinghualingensis TaxID=2986475 RepID=UPI0021F0D887|nr:EAL domain-containing protein [Roseomonas sp. SXEYE001]